MSATEEAAGRLHSEVIEFARTAGPAPAETRRKDAALAQLRDACAATFGRRCRVEPFGSHVHGISLAGSDLDVVVTGLVEPRDPRAGEGWGSAGQGRGVPILGPLRAGARQEPE